jgi:hypothetical protein
MTSGIADTIEHPLDALVSDVRAALQSHGSAPAWTVAPSRIPALLEELVEAQNALDSVRLRLLREADRHQVGEAAGHTSTANWWAARARVTRPAAHRELRLAESLDDSTHETAADALASGVVSAEQAAVITHAVDQLPVDVVGPALRRRAETDLVALAERHDPKELRLLGRRVLEVQAPEIAEGIERKRLEREEQHARETARFTMSPDGEGSMLGRFKIPVLAGQMLAQHLAAIAAPKHRRATQSPQNEEWEAPLDPLQPRVSRPLKLGQAFAEYIRTRTGAPKAGGMAATVVVTMTMTDLLGTSESPATVLDTGERITAGEARRLACEAGIIPAVLGTPSQVLDLGRKTRFHTEPQRIAIALRDGGCCVEGCDWPPGMSQIHHPHPWSRGGTTSVENGIMLCPRHHTLIHGPRYLTETRPSGKIRLIKRT